MNTIIQTYINALLADTSYVRLHEGEDIDGPNTPLRIGQRLTDAIAVRMTIPQAQLITDNFEVLNQELSATGGNDYLDVGVGSDWMYGGAGADFLQGAEGDDEVRGDGFAATTSLAFVSPESHGHDLLDGGAGNDRMSGDGGDDDEVLGGLGNADLSLKCNAAPSRSQCLVRQQTGAA